LPQWFEIGNTAPGAQYYMDSTMDELRIHVYQRPIFRRGPKKMRTTPSDTQRRLAVM
jgi:hypothetical protein